MPHKILVVDDDDLMHKLFQHHLERAGYEVLCTTSSREGIEIAAREQPKVIVMDIMMPDVDGLAALAELKEVHATKQIPVIMITANSHHVSRQESEDSGAALFLTKPFSPTQLLNEIKRLIPEDDE